MEKTIFRHYATRLSALALCSAAFCTLPTLAQGVNRGTSTAQQQAQLNALIQMVGLTDDQLTHVKAIEDYAAKKMADIISAGGDAAAMRPKLMAIRDDQHTKIRGLLTNSQKAKYDAYLAANPKG